VLVDDYSKVRRHYGIGGERDNTLFLLFFEKYGGERHILDFYLKRV